jgi:hypothetical protein
MCCEVSVSPAGRRHDDAAATAPGGPLTRSPDGGGRVGLRRGDVGPSRPGCQSARPRVRERRRSRLAVPVLVWAGLATRRIESGRPARLMQVTNCWAVSTTRIEAYQPELRPDVIGERPRRPARRSARPVGVVVTARFRAEADAAADKRRAEAEQARWVREQRRGTYDHLTVELQLQKQIIGRTLPLWGARPRATAPVHR